MKMNWKNVFPRGSRFFETPNGILYCGDVLEVLSGFPSESVDCVITSPPYWAMRNYGENTNTIWGGNPNCEHEWKWEGAEESDGGSEAEFCEKCGAWYGQLGLESDFNLYLEHLWQVFDEVYRVLKPTGTLWVNLGDTYYGGGKGRTDGINKAGGIGGERFRGIGYPSRSLCLIPERFAIGMIDRGWILRNQIIWHKPNAMPESVKNRFTNDWEKIFFFVKQRKYYFKRIIEPVQASVIEKRMFEKRRENYSGKYSRIQPKGTVYRNKRTVWSINTKPFKGAHFAVFPPELVEIPIEAGCSENGIVMDIFMGSGTTAVVAEKLGRRWVGIEINHGYCEIAKKRISEMILNNNTLF